MKPPKSSPHEDASARKARGRAQTTFPRIGSCPLCGASVRIDLAVVIRCAKCGFRPRDLWTKTRTEDGKVTLRVKTPPNDPSPVDE